jgi:hypothetical protein
VASALPCIKGPEADELLAAAMAHPEVDVQLEAATSAALIGKPQGVALLAKHCLDWKYSSDAQRRLADLDREEAIPAEIKDPEFQAKVKFSDEFYYEYDAPPDEIQVVDHRTLKWPLADEPMPVYLLQTTIKAESVLDEDEIVCGVVADEAINSSILAHRPPEDAYAIHCYWELQGDSLIIPLDGVTPADYAFMLRQWDGGMLEDAEVIEVAEIDGALRYPQPSVGLAAARLKGAEGWVVLDGKRSRWYPKDEQPVDEYDIVAVLELHVGRQLLGFKEQPDRNTFLPGPPKPKDPGLVVAAYEKLLEEAKTGDEDRRSELLTTGISGIAMHFHTYADAKAAASKQPRDAVVAKTYEQILALVKANEEKLGVEAYDLFTPLGVHFRHYVEVLASTKRKAEIGPLIKVFEPHWQDPGGYGSLAAAWHLAGDDDAAETYLKKLRDESDEWHLGEDASLLARIWHGGGREDEAHELLIECLQKTAIDGRLAARDERADYEEWFQANRKTYLELFPDRGEAELKEQGIPASLK